MSESAESEGRRVRSVPPRRSHTKSRKGCTDCKRRKVKCDESAPSCFNCTRRGVICSLGSSFPIPPPSPDAYRDFDPVRRRTDPEPPHLTSLELLANRWQFAPSTSDTRGQGLELMHHYTSITADTLAMRPSIQHVWRCVIPEIGYNSPFLMHGILAAAALHKAHLLPAHRKHYAHLAVYHQTAGLEGFRAGLEKLADGGWKPSDEGWKPYLCFSSMVVLCMSWQPLRAATTLPQPQGFDDSPDVLDVFVFIRGIRSFLQPYQMLVDGSSLAPLTEATWSHSANAGVPPEIANSILPGDTFEVLAKLKEFYKDTMAEHRREGFLYATDQLIKSFHLVATSGTRPELSMVMVVPYVVPDEILSDVVATKPHAMIFLAYLAGLFRILEARFWFLTGLSKRLFEVIDASLTRYPLHMEMTRWPRENLFEIYET